MAAVRAGTKGEAPLGRGALAGRRCERPWGGAAPGRAQRTTGNLTATRPGVGGSAGCSLGGLALRPSWFARQERHEPASGATRGRNEESGEQGAAASLRLSQYAIKSS